ncbi:MAG: DNA cytosine methyltransferase [Clostridia bacterium]|nr:DNA cytosine methyltransferase [Clostridia bacterium]
MKFRLVSLFSGAGGMDKGFQNAGFKIIWANDFDKDAVNTYKKNLGEHIVLGDITKIPSTQIPNDVDVVIGGFPCQGFSVNNIKRNMEDKRNFLYKELLRIVKDKNPKVFVAENVKGLLSMEKGKVIEMIKSDFEKLGYKVDYKLLLAAEYGVPELRERVIIMGNRIGVDNIFPKATHYTDYKNYSKDTRLLKTPTVEETIGFLANERLRDNEFEINGRIIYDHIASEKVADTFWGRKYPVNQFEICDYLKYWRNKSGWTTTRVDKHFGYKYTAGHWFRKDNGSGSIPKPDDWWELKKILGFDDKFDKVVTTLELKDITFEQSLRISNWDRPSDTITATQPEIHPNKKRRLSVRECAMIQTFPDDFIFTGSLNSKYRQIGNAVPVLMATKIAECVKKMLEE